jgi:hypothetical protein
LTFCLISTKAEEGYCALRFSTSITMSSSPISRKKLKHRASSKTQDHTLLDFLSLDGCLLPPSHAVAPVPATPPSRTATHLDISLSDVDARDDDDDDDNNNKHEYASSSPLAYLSSIFTSDAFQLNTSSSPLQNRAITMYDERRRSPTTAYAVVPDKFQAAVDPMMLDCLSLDGGCILPPSSTSTTMNNMVMGMMTRKKKEL